jgi:hypothetical protein
MLAHTLQPSTVGRPTRRERLDVVTSGTAREEAVGSPSNKGGHDVHHDVGCRHASARSSVPPDRTPSTGVQEGESRYRPNGHGMRRRPSGSFTVYTAGGQGSYRGYGRADSAARWVAEATGETVIVVNNGTGQSWQVSKRRSIDAYALSSAPSIAATTSVAPAVSPHGHHLTPTRPAAIASAFAEVMST